MSLIARLFKELRRRQVFGTALVYIAAAWVLIQVFDTDVIRDVLRIDPKGVFIAAIVGFPIALVAGWFYDITRTGIFRTPPEIAEDTFNRRLRREDFVILATLALMWAGGFVLVYVPPASDKSIAVLPFENTSHDPDSAIFAFGVRNDLQVHLQRIKDLKIVAAESADKVDGKLPVARIASQLGVAYVLKGSIDRVSDRIRVNVSLIDSANDFQAWAGSYDRELSTEGLFDIRSDIALTITRELQSRLTDVELQILDQRPTDVFPAYEAYLLGQQRLAVATTDSVDDAVKYFQRAIELDPNFAEAYVGLASSYHRHEMLSGQSLVGRTVVTDPELAAAVDKALRLNDRLGSAYAARADIKYHRVDFDGMREDFERAIELDPNDESIYYAYGHNMANRYPEKSLSLLQRAIELNPLSPDIRSAAARTLGRLNRHQEALDQYCRAIEIEPHFARTYFQGGITQAFQMGNVAEAVRWTSRAVAEDPNAGNYWHMLGYYYYALGDDARALDAAERYIALSPTAIRALSGILNMYSAIPGNHDREVEYLARIAEIYPQDPANLFTHFSYYLRERNYVEALAQITKLYPTLTATDSPIINDDNMGAAILLAVVFVKTGEQPRANHLLDDVLSLLQAERRGSAVRNDEEIAALAWRGKTEEALSGLQQQLDAADFLFWWRQKLVEPPWPEKLLNDPEFQAVKSKLQAEAAAQLASVRAWEAAGKLEMVECR